MPFTVRPVLAAMREVYAQPPPAARFRAYPRLLHGGTKADLVVPVQHFNPMAKAALVARLDELRQLQAETLAAEALLTVNTAAPPGEPTVQLALNLADDAHGGWTNRCTTDFANKFDLAATLQRGFCTPIVWASEAFSEALIRRRVLAQAWRCRYQLRHLAPATLAEHLAQEIYVAQQLGQPAGTPQPVAQAAYARLLAATDAPTLLAFFYGDEAARPLGHRPLGGLGPGAGFALARALAGLSR